MNLSLIAVVPEAQQGLLAARGVAGFVLAFTPAFVGYIGTVAIGAVLRQVALVAAFSGAAFAVLAVVIGPAAIYVDRLLGNDARREPQRSERRRSVSS